MGLGAKVKEILHSPESQDATTGDVDPNTPGSFPQDGMTAKESQTDTATGHEHNKLHKAYDPRGSGGHGHTDSGVGFTDTHDSSSHREAPFEKPSDTFDSERTAEPSTERRLHENTNLGSQETASGAAGSSTKENPYWGDLPLGQGVYNTVAGHGSAEDHVQGRQAIHTGAYGIGTATTSSHPDRGTQMDSQGQPFSTQATDPYSAQRDIRGDTDQRTSSSRVNDGLVGAAVAGTAGAGLYGLNREHRAAEGAAPSQPSSGAPANAPRSDYSSQAIDPHTKITEPYSSQKDVQNPYERSAGTRFHEGLASTAIAGTAGAGAYELNKNRRADETPQRVDEATTREESKGRSFPLLHRGRKDKDVQENKHSKEATREHRDHQDKSGGFFHRSGHKDNIKPGTEEDPAEETHHGSKAVPALAGAGVGGAATYAATRDRSDDNRAQDATTASRYEDSATLGRTGQQYDTRYGSNEGCGALSRQPADSFASNPGMQPDQQQGTHRDHKLAAGAATGLGAGALAFREKHSNTQDLTEDNSGVFQTSGPGMATTTNNAASAHGATRHAPLTVSDHLAQPTSDTTPPTVTQNANEGKYNTLSSGTPSGVKIGGDLGNN